MVFVQYVSMLRLEKFKHLLLSSNDSIQSLVQSVGYNDASTFIRKFKQAEGVTPGEYRSLARKRM